MKKILVPVDFSEHSEYAMEVAAGLARKHGIGIVVLHMMGLATDVLEADENEAAAEARYFMKLVRKRFQTFLDKPYLKGVPVTEIVQNYKVFHEIQEVAEELGTDLIVMGSHGIGGMKDIFVGSNTEKVVRSSTFPVLVVKRSMGDFNPKKAVFAMDFEVGNLGAYQRAQAFLRQWQTEVHLVHVNLPNLQFMSTTQIREKAEVFFKRAHKGSLPSDVQMAYVADYSIEQGLYAYAREVHADLIAVPTHGRRGLSHFFRGSIGEDLVNHAPLPVLTFRV